MGKLPLTTSRGASPPHDIVTAPQGQPVSRAMLCAATHPGTPDLLNAGSWFVDVSATALFVDVSIWLPFLHLLGRSDLVQERAFARPVSSISFRTNLPDSLSTLTWMSLLQLGNDAAPFVQLGGICQCPRSGGHLCVLGVLHAPSHTECELHALSHLLSVQATGNFVFRCCSAR